jgi:hypothetical protein
VRARRQLAALVAPRVGGEGADAAEAWLERVIEVTESRTPNADDTAPRPSRVHALVVLVQTPVSDTPSRRAPDLLRDDFCQ